MSAVTKLKLYTTDGSIDLLPPYATRGLSQTFAWIEGAHQFDRTVNGTLKALTDPNFVKKVATAIECSEVDGMSEIEIGTPVTIECAFELNYKPEMGDTTGSGAMKTVTSGSVRIADGFLFYRPKIDCLITDFQFNYDDFGRVNGWTATAEEV